jgi:hypothetical protein
MSLSLSCGSSSIHLYFVLIYFSYSRIEFYQNQNNLELFLPHQVPFPYIFFLTIACLELAALILAAIILNWISHDGKSNWFEGVMLTAVFIVIAIGFFFVG